jgi:hypothetical protein
MRSSYMPCGPEGSLFEGTAPLPPIDRTAIEAMCNRSKQLVLTCAAMGQPDALRFAQGSLNALRSLLDLQDVGFAAHRDDSRGGYQPLAGYEAAWAALPVGVERFTLAQVQEFLRTHGVEIATDAVANGKVDGVEQLKDCKAAVINVHDEHDAVRAEGRDGAGEHEAPLVVRGVDIVAEGGAA